MRSNYWEHEASYITASERLTAAAGGFSPSVSQKRPQADLLLDVKSQTTRCAGRDREIRPRRESS